jgi:hypothetical protein
MTTWFDLTDQAGPVISASLSGAIWTEHTSSEKSLYVA